MIVVVFLLEGLCAAVGAALVRDACSDLLTAQSHDARFWSLIALVVGVGLTVSGVAMMRQACVMEREE